MCRCCGRCWCISQVFTRRFGHSCLTQLDTILWLSRLEFGNTWFDSVTTTVSFANLFVFRRQICLQYDLSSAEACACCKHHCFMRQNLRARCSLISKPAICEALLFCGALDPEMTSIWKGDVILFLVQGLFSDPVLFFKGKELALAILFLYRLYYVH